MTRRIAALPHLGHYYIGAKPVAELFGEEIPNLGVWIKFVKQCLEPPF